MNFYVTEPDSNPTRYHGPECVGGPCKCGYAQLQEENKRLRARTHEIQERADKKLARLEKFYRVTHDRTFPFLMRHGWHPDDGTPNARVWYGELWRQSRDRATAAEARSKRLEQVIRDNRDTYTNGMVLHKGQTHQQGDKECPICAVLEESSS